MTKEELLALVLQYLQEKQKIIQPNSSVSVSGSTIYPEDILEVVDTVLDGWFTEGKKCAEFRKRLSEVVQLPRCTLVNSGSSASLVAMMAMRDLYYKNGRKYVITPALAFPTTVYPIIQSGMIPWFVDVEQSTLNFNENEVIDLLKRDDVAGVVAAHTLGFPYDEKKIADALSEEQFLLVDCADALGATLYDKPVGSYGTCATLSFFPAHQISCGEGGSVLCKSAQVLSLLRSYSSWGRSCFLSGTMVKLANSSVKPIDTIYSGAKVMNHLGDIDEVIGTSRWHYTGDIYEIKARTIPKISVTSEHPFYVYDFRNEKYCWIQAQDLNKDIHWLLEHKGKNSVKFSNNVLTLYYQTMTEHKSFDIPIDIGILHLMGYYLSQGNLVKGKKGGSGYIENKYYFYRVDFTFNTAKTDVISDLISLMRKYFDVAYSIRKRGNATVISFKSRKAYEFFVLTCGSISYNKRISDVIFDLCSQQDLLHLVGGYILGDGNIDWQGCSLYSTSSTLFYQLRGILLANNIVGSLTVRTKDKHHSSVVNGKLIEQKHDLYNLVVYGQYAEKFLYSVGIYSFTAKTRKTFVRDLGEYFAYPIVSIKSYVVDLIPVYNLEVKNAHSYHAGCVAVHNCICLPGQDNTCGNRFNQNFPTLPAHYDHKYIFSHLGYNLKMTEMQAALGVAQLSHLTEFVDARNRNFTTLYQNLTSVFGNLSDGLQFVKIISGSKPSPFGFPITVRSDLFDKNELVAYLELCGVRTRPIFAGNITRQPAMVGMEYKSNALYVTDYIMKNSFWVGVHPGLTLENLNYILDTLYTFLKSKV